MSRNPVDIETMKLRVLYFGMAAMLGLLVINLWKLQVARDDDWMRAMGAIEKQSVRRVRLPELRGRILDRNGEVLADNRPSHSIAMYVEELRQPGPRPVTRTLNKVMSVIEELSYRLQIPADVVRDDIIAHYRAELPLPFVIWEDVDQEVVARWAERAAGLPGVAVYSEAVRVYPHEELACHLIGHVSPVGKRESETERYNFYPPSMQGKEGLEFLLEDRLSGEAGGQTLQVDVFGYRNQVLDVKKPRRGDNARLSLDRNVQALAEESLHGERGSVVVLDVTNGDVLAMASYPGYDLNSFVPSISHAEYDLLRNDTRKPLLNRAVQEYYAPGSTIKPVVALAALNSGRATSASTFHCPGHFDLTTNMRIHCGTRSGHGTIDMAMSLERSCNVYYWRLALQCGYEYVYEEAKKFGFGQRTGILVQSEKPGVLPDKRWKWEKYREGWSRGDTCNVAIGQGFLDVTPLQMANMTAAIANGGTLFKPRLLLGWYDGETGAYEPELPEMIRRIQWSPNSLSVVREGMRRVIHSSRGTGKLARVEGLTYAGKTGTAQFGARGNRTYRSWMVAFAPYDQPRYAIALVIEETEQSSGLSAAPRMREIVEGLFGGGEDV